MSKLRVYQGHLMEGKEIGMGLESERRCKEFRQLVGSEYEYLTPESWQASVEKQDIEKIDYMKWQSASIIIVDLYDQGLLSEKGNPLLGIGSCVELGWTINHNKTQRNKKICVIITRTPVNVHPFFKSSGIHKNCTSLEEAALYVKEKKWKK